MKEETYIAKEIINKYYREINNYPEKSLDYYDYGLSKKKAIIEVEEIIEYDNIQFKEAKEHYDKEFIQQHIWKMNSVLIEIDKL